MEGPLRYRQLRNYANRRNIRIRHLRDRFNPLEEYHNEDFRLRFRFRKDSVIDLAKILEKDLQHRTRRGLPLTPMQQMLIVLRFYATGTFQRVIGDLFGVSAFAACTAIHKVSKAIAKQRAQFLSFPEKLADTKRKFYDVAHFPGVIGAIDCTHIRIICRNKENAMAFVNRKHFYSIYVQAVCESDAFITNIVARCPGSTHDSRIFDNSNIADKLRDGAIDGILVGDSGYACRAYLMTQILKPKNAGEVRYNTAHRRTRCVIERCFGLLKRRFPCLHWDCAPLWRIPSSLLWLLQCCIILPLCIESKTLKTLKTKMSHLTLLPQQTPVGMANASSLFHDTLLNKINGLIKLHVRFIANIIGNKKNIHRN